MGEKEMGGLLNADRGLGKAKEGATLARQESDATENDVMFNPKEYPIERSAGGQEAPSTDEVSARHDTPKSSIGNIR